MSSIEQAAAGFYSFIWYENQPADLIWCSSSQQRSSSRSIIMQIDWWLSLWGRNTEDFSHHSCTFITITSPEQNDGRHSSNTFLQSDDWTWNCNDCVEYYRTAVLVQNTQKISHWLYQTSSSFLKSHFLCISLNLFVFLLTFLVHMYHYGSYTLTHIIQLAHSVMRCWRRRLLTFTHCNVHWAWVPWWITLNGINKTVLKSTTTLFITLSPEATEDHYNSLSNTDLLQVMYGFTASERVNTCCETELNESLQFHVPSVHLISVIQLLVRLNSSHPQGTLVISL